MKRERRSWIRREKGGANGHSLFLTYKRNSLDRGRPFELTEDDFISMSQANCYYCGAKPSNSYNMKGSNGAFKYNGLDRVDNSLGYSVNNCVPCCKMCNVAKSTRSVNDFLTWAHRVYSHSVSRIASY